MTGYQDVLLRVENDIGWITLNRPKALNAIDHAMVCHIDAYLAEWANSDAVGAIVVVGAGERGMCAGGGIRFIYDDIRSGGRASVPFLRDEYQLNARIAEYPKPYLALMDGIVMGGGVGLSANGTIRIVTDRTMVAMPETGIGFIPDTGGTWLLSRAPGELGTHLALTAARFTAADAIMCGFADYYLPAARIPTVLGSLRPERIGQAVESLAEPAPASALQAHQPRIDECYAADTAGEILSRLRARTEAAAQQAAAQIQANSPIAVTVALRALRQARRLATLREELNQELLISVTALESHDLMEGIRARIVDKDCYPRWSPATITEVTSDIVDRYFAAAGLGLSSQAREPSPRMYDALGSWTRTHGLCCGGCSGIECPNQRSWVPG